MVKRIEHGPANCAGGHAGGRRRQGDEQEASHARPHRRLPHKPRPQRGRSNACTCQGDEPGNQEGDDQPEVPGRKLSHEMTVEE